MVSVSTLRLVLIGLIAGGAIGVLFAIFEGSVTQPSTESRSHTSYTFRHSRRQTIRSAGRVSTATPAALLQPQDAQAIPTKPEATDEASTTKAGQEAGAQLAVNAETAGVSQVGSSASRMEGADPHHSLATEPQLRRVCGSPAVDGYAHVDPKCLQDSPTNKLWWLTHQQVRRGRTAITDSFSHVGGVVSPTLVCIHLHPVMAHAPAGTAHILQDGVSLYR